MTIAHDEDLRSAALTLLEQGEATLSEAARLAGVSRQVVRYWAETANIDYRKQREARLKRAWRDQGMRPR